MRYIHPRIFYLIFKGQYSGLEVRFGLVLEQELTKK